jgi:hypothetical protein
MTLFTQKQGTIMLTFTKSMCYPFSYQSQYSIACLYTFRLFCLGALVYLLPIRVLIIVLSILLTLSVSDEGHSYLVIAQDTVLRI